MTATADPPRTTIITRRGMHGSPGARRALAADSALAGDSGAAILTVLSEGAR